MPRNSFKSVSLPLDLILELDSLAFDKELEGGNWKRPDVIKFLYNFYRNHAINQKPLSNSNVQNETSSNSN